MGQDELVNKYTRMASTGVSVRGDPIRELDGRADECVKGTKSWKSEKSEGC